MLLGAGEMGELTAQYLVDADVASLRVANRTLPAPKSLQPAFQARRSTLTIWPTNWRKPTSSSLRHRRPGSS